jgi:hypothetical protein
LYLSHQLQRSAVLLALIVHSFELGLHVAGASADCPLKQAQQQRGTKA